MNFWKQADRHYGANETIWPIRITATFTADVYATDWEDAVDAAEDIATRMVDAGDIDIAEGIDIEVTHP